MNTADFDYALPPELIAQHPLAERDQSRLLVLRRQTGRREHRRFREALDYLRPGDLLVFNDSRVIRARLRGLRAGTGGRFELLLISENQRNDWWVMMRPAKRVSAGSGLRFLDLQGKLSLLEAAVQEKSPEGLCRLIFHGERDLLTLLEALGEVPLPPYIQRQGHQWMREDVERYQTVYAKSPGSVAAPTAGLHFSQGMLGEMERRGIQACHVTLHVGPGTFAPVKVRDLTQHPMHEERFEITLEAAEKIQKARREGRRVLAVGTTTVRVLETVAARNQGNIAATREATRLFIYPPHEFKVVDGLITNFHLPKSTLLMLVCAMASPGSSQGREWVLQAYREAIQQRYRFFSYGDAMLLI